MNDWFPGTLAVLLASTAPALHAQWLELEAPHYSIFYRQGFANDARAVQVWADAAERLMREKYGVEPTHYHMWIYLEPAPTAEANVENALNRCCRSVGGTDSVGTIYMLSPSSPMMRSTTAISSLGMRKSSADYNAKILVSEYIPIGHYEVQNARPTGGWQYYTAPNWFVQGLQEYDAIYHSTPRNRDSTSKRLIKWAKAHPRVVTCCSPDLKFTDDYNGGASFMAFLAQQFGEGIHARILRSGAPTFAEALTEQTKPYTRQQLVEQFHSWLERQ